MLSTGTTLHSTRSRTSCLRRSSFEAARLTIDDDDDDVDDDKLENQVMTSSVVLPMHCLKLEADTDHS